MFPAYYGGLRYVKQQLKQGVQGAYQALLRRMRC